MVSGCQNKKIFIVYKYIMASDSDPAKVLSFCVACSKRKKEKTFTTSVDEVEIVTKNGRKMMKGFCTECHKGKCRLIPGSVKISKGKGIADSFIEKLPVELHLVDFSDGVLKPKRYNFCGPGTKLEKRLNPDGTPKDWSKPINKLDEGCMAHDKTYTSKDPKTRDEGDVKLKKVAEEVLKDSTSGLSDRLNSRIVAKAMDLIHRGSGKH